ncbi:DeoR/GlpR transcriptional regulator [Microlunatus elymi]|uniref:DeoR/GlpR transcriptional regulator n=1 Tax=Microlunatus elymi TaxID=2596828 RepID=A0A516Q3Q1_9ACTN|nr:DeoR/GlpR family DNA-binding transcription regulator [Microlunatus elymi]QDP98048.1 DeoR/GlpR transcriptional regulator [Microlunatus elymi]
MTRAERLTALLERLVENGRIDVEQTADHFGVSAATIRRDLDHLADQQLLSRTHGGAVPNATSYDLPIRYKSTNRAEAKTRIAQRAVEMLWPGCTVAMNGGTTTVEIARAIPTSAPLRGGVTVVTNAINIATELTVRPFIKIVVCGGVARPQSYELVGSLASETLSQLTPDLCFLGATGIDADAGVSTNDEAEAAINRIMVTRAKQAFVVVDATKFGEVGFSRICHLSEVTAVLTDTDADPDQVKRMRASGVEVILA